jgi:hypothetical protein
VRSGIAWNNKGRLWKNRLVWKKKDEIQSKMPEIRRETEKVMSTT